MNQTEQARGRRDYGFYTVFFLVLFLLLNYILVYHKVISGAGDYPAHLYNLLPMFQGSEPIKGWMAAPHCLWHLTVLFFAKVCYIPVEASAAFATCIYDLFYYLVLLWVIRRVFAYAGMEESEVRSNFIALTFCFVQSLYFYWLDTGGRYFGVFSANPLDSPTQICLRGFIVLTFCLVVDLLSYESDNTYRPVFFRVQEKTYKYYILLAVLLFLSTVMKPTFSEMFVPAVAFYMLGTWIYKLIRKEAPAHYFKRCLMMFLCALPTIIYMLIQYIVFFIFEGSYGGEEGVIFTGWLEVWKLFSDNIFLSVLLGLAFPIYMILLDIRFFLKTIAGRLAIVSYAVGFVEAGILGEGGNRLGHANFLWPMMTGMLLLWLLALLRLMVLERSREYTGFKRALLLFGWFLYFCHVFCGILYYCAEVFA